MDSARKVDDTLWAYRTTFKTPIGMSLYQMIFGKACHLPFEVEHKAIWDLKILNLHWSKDAPMRMEDLNEIDEFRLKAYDSAKIYKICMKHFHDLKKEFVSCDWVLLCKSRMMLFPGK